MSLPRRAAARNVSAMRSSFGPLLAAGLAIVIACDRPSVLYRGPGLAVDTLPLSDVVGVYRATLGGAFRLDDPTLSLLVDPMLLSRESGLAGGDSMPSKLLAMLRGGGLVKGTCKVPVRNTRTPLICRGERAGYVVRFSQPFALGPDSVQVYLVVQQYALPTGPITERMRFERAYHVVKRGSTWRAVREGRLPQP
jgi:hypothetical protein